MNVAEHLAAQAVFAAGQEDERQKLIKLCQVARRDRRWTDEDWAHIKRTHGGADSLTDMDVGELDAVLAYARRCGFRVTHKRQDGSRSRPLTQDRQAKLIRAVWLLMARLGIIRHADESALGSWLANKRGNVVVTDLALLTAPEMDRSINRIRGYFCRELGQGRLYCPDCGREFTPNPKQAWAWAQEKIGCDNHTLPIPYRWRRG